ncbi:hypothetical protein BH24ACI5_BH24ACI5_11520 [soil metagenome]
MPLTSGTRLGPYEITGAVGAGGMGEVYRARDTQLQREVAIKVLPPLFALDAERLARFTREAQTLAALNHPNIAQIYGLEADPSSDGGRALVMELVPGDDLSVLIARGPVSLADALPIAKQIADALEAAHELGIVHRDLKPANVKVRPDGTVKVLDFGLAKAMAPAGNPGTDAMQSPTITGRATQLGTIIGTAAYMAPEQAKGKAVDKRADIWAFGVVFYEMLTGRGAFRGDDISDVLASVLTREPDWALLPATTPSAVRRLLARCLERDPRRRLRDIGDVQLELEEAAQPQLDARSEGTRSERMRSWLPWAATAVAGAVAVWALSARPPVDRGTAGGHFTIRLPDDAALVISDLPTWSEGPLAVSPDGRQVVYVAPGGRGTQLFARAMNDLTPRALAGTEGARLPFFSPDGQWIGFFADGMLKKAPLAGGTPATLATAPDGTGASWGSNGEILFAPTYSSGLFAVAEAGGIPRRVTTLDSAAGDDVHGWPQVVPGHHAVLLTVIAWSRETSAIVLVNLDTGERRPVLQEASFARYVPDTPAAATGHLVFVRDGALMAAPFDPAGTGQAGTPVSVLERVRAAQFDISASGVLAYAPGSGTAPDYSLVWVDRAGVSRPINTLPRGYEDLHLSPDGRRVALTIEEPGFESPAHVWLADTDRGTLTRLTFDGFSRDPVWAPDGQSIVFGSKRGEDTFGLYLQRLDGRSPAELIWASPTPIWPDPQSWTPDSRIVVFTTKGTDTGDDIWTLSLDDRKAQPWLQDPGGQWGGRLSPDGAWMAYNSNESGRDEVYVQPFPGPGPKRLVSDKGGVNPIWSRNGSELFYRRAGEFFVVGVETEGGFTVGKPASMFSGRYRLTGRDFDVSPDGTRFVMMRNDDPRTSQTINLLLDWRQVLEARLQGTR